MPPRSLTSYEVWLLLYRKKKIGRLFLFVWHYVSCVVWCLPNMNKILLVLRNNYVETKLVDLVGNYNDRIISSLNGNFFFVASNKINRNQNFPTRFFQLSQAHHHAVNSESLTQPMELYHAADMLWRPDGWPLFRHLLVGLVAQTRHASKMHYCPHGFPSFPCCKTRLHFRLIVLLPPIQTAVTTSCHSKIRSSTSNCRCSVTTRPFSMCFPPLRSAHLRLHGCLSNCCPLRPAVRVKTTKTRLHFDLHTSNRNVLPDFDQLLFCREGFVFPVL